MYYIKTHEKGPVQYADISDALGNNNDKKQQQQIKHELSVDLCSVSFNL
jgi:hypothetical protein